MVSFDFLKSALEAIPQAATSPYALIAFTLSILAWVVISWRVARNRQLLDSLQKLPQKDRLKALEIEMGRIHVAAGLTAEQWLKSRTQAYIFSGVIVLCVLIAVLTAIAMTKHTRGKVDIQIGLHRPNATSKPSPSASLDAARSLLVSDPFYATTHLLNPLEESTYKLTYIETRTKEGIEIHPALGYAMLLESGGPVVAVDSLPFEEKPTLELSVKVTNNTNETVFLTECSCKVKSSEVYDAPIVVFQKDIDYLYHLLIANVGWGTVKNPILHFRLESDPNYKRNFDLKWYEQTNHELKLKSFDDSMDVDLTEYLDPKYMKPAYLNGEHEAYEWITIGGIFEFGEKSEPLHKIRFRAPIGVACPPPSVGAMMPPSAKYDLALEAGKSNIEQIVEISQTLKPGEADHFLLNVFSDKSGIFDAAFSFRTASGLILPGDKIKLFVLTPRWHRRVELAPRQFSPKDKAPAAPE